MDISKENRICNNPLAAATRTKERYISSPIPRTEGIYKLSKLKNVGIPETIKEETVFNFTGKKDKKPKQTEKVKKNKLLDVSKDAKGKNIKQKSIY
tara:strand:+ start:920 stop:1207 length:288 start_codon:yes stop_codon:yes gene_type:complete